jgi:hypothetical protein
MSLNVPSQIAGLELLQGADRAAGFCARLPGVMRDLVQPARTGASVTYFFKFGVWQRGEELQKHSFRVPDESETILLYSDK